MAESVLSPVATLPSVQQGGLRRLKMKHRRILALHLAGQSNAVVAETLGCKSSYVSQVLNDPLSRTFLEAAYRDYDQEIRALTPLAVEAIRRNLDNPDGQVALRAADLAFKVNGRYESKQDDRPTAEDVIERILERVEADGSKIVVKERRLLKHSMSHSGTPQEDDDAQIQ